MLPTLGDHLKNHRWDSSRHKWYGNPLIHRGGCTCNVVVRLDSLMARYIALRVHVVGEVLHSATFLSLYYGKLLPERWNVGTHTLNLRGNSCNNIAHLLRKFYAT